MNVVFLGLSISSSWGNGHATNYRALVRELVRGGHRVSFCERDVPWYRAHRDLPQLDGAELILYESLADLERRAGAAVADADLVILGSYVPDGVAVADWMLARTRGVSAFYDIDTPITLAKLEAGDEEYLARRLLERFDLYLSFTAGPTLERLADLGVRRPRPFHCLVDPERYRPLDVTRRWDLGYLGTFAADRQPQVEALLLEPARALENARFALAGPQYPTDSVWPPNLERIDHVAPQEHAAFYCAQRFTLNLTRADMRRAGYSPSVRLFEAAACGVPIISDSWAGLEEILIPGREILVAETAADVIDALNDVDDATHAAIAAAARTRVLAEHTAARRVEQLEQELAALAMSGAGA